MITSPTHELVQHGQLGQHKPDSTTPNYLVHMLMFAHFTIQTIQMLKLVFVSAQLITSLKTVIPFAIPVHGWIKNLSGGYTRVIDDYTLAIR